jgi:radical SAM superfamily enzyme YgiQ (UPF0313 family)
MNILFTTSAAPVKSPFFTNEKRPPLGVGSLISLVRNEGHNVFFIDNYLNPSNFIEEGYLQKNDIDIVGIHANTICYRDTLKMFSSIDELRRKGLWNGKIVVGGPHTSVASDTIPEFVDHVVQGEGERAVLQIVNSGVKERIIKQERVHDLDSLPFQPWDIFNSLPYDYSCQWFEIRPVFTMNTSRGCPFNCTFCSVGSIWGKQYICFSAERIIAEVEYLVKEYGAKGIYFREDNFTLSSKRTEEFCERLIKKHINISWACETRVDNLSKELVELMSAAGCKAFYFGVESGSPKILGMIKKQITIEQIERAINLCKRYGVKSYCSLITGLPGENYEDYLMSMKLMEKLKPHAYVFNIYVAIPNSSLYRYILESNLYEYVDDVGLLYPPGYDVKTKYFYGKDGEYFVDYRFNQRSMFDRKLINELQKAEFKRNLMKLSDSVLTNIFSKIRKRKQNHNYGAR